MAKTKLVVSIDQIQKTACASPCEQCPFRIKGGWKGYLGPYDSVQALLEEAELLDGLFKCHMKVEEIASKKRGMNLTENHRQSVVEAPICAGGLIYFNHICKLSRIGNVAYAQDRLGEHPDIAKSPAQLISHHERRIKDGKR